MRGRETTTSRGTVAPGRATRARRIAFSTRARAPTALGASRICRVDRTSVRGRANAFDTSSVARYGARPPTTTSPTVTPAAMGTSLGGGGGTVGGGSVVVGGGGAVVVVVVSASIPAPVDATAKAAAKPTSAHAVSAAAPIAKALLFTIQV